MKLPRSGSLLCLALACSPLPSATSGPEGTDSSGEPDTTTAPTSSASASDTSADPTSDSTTGDPTTTDAPDDTTSTGDPTTTTDATTLADSDTGVVPPGCDEVHIVDPALEAVIRDKLDIPEGPISGEAALSITQLFAFAGSPVHTLAGIECFSNLVYLHVGPSDISDVTPAAAIVGLGSLGLPGSQVTDLGPLVNLPKLSELDLSDAAIVDIGPLAEIPTLWRIYLSSTAVTDFSPLTGLPTLTEVLAGDTDPDDLTVFTTLPELRHLRLSSCGLTDVSGLAGAAVEQLEIEDNAIVDLAGLDDLPQLRYLDIDHNLIVDLAPLGKATTLEKLRIHDNEITTLAPLAGATALDTLDVSRNPLTDLTGLAKLPLRQLIAREIGLKQLQAIAPTTLEDLRLESNKITDLAPLAGHSALELVIADGNLITSFKPLEAAPWVLDRCAQISALDNPIDADTIATIIPAMCELDMSVAWPGGACSPQGLRCGGEN